MDRTTLIATAAELSLSGAAKLKNWEIAHDIAWVERMTQEMTVQEQVQEQAPADEPELIEVPVKVNKRRSNRERDANGAVIRKGRNLSGNTPWNRKFYYMDVEKHTAAGEIKVAKQCRMIMAHMIDAGITTNRDAEQGITIVDEMKAAGKISTPIASANLFAYYRKTMEQFGLVHALLNDDDGEPEDNAEEIETDESEDNSEE